MNPEDDDRNRWVIHGQRSVYETEWMSVQLADVVQPSGHRYEHHIVTLRAAALIVLLDAARSRVLMTRRHRVVHDTWSWEIPGGLVEPGETALDAAIRELLEETGYRPATIVPIQTFEPMIGTVRSAHHVFLALDAEFVQEATEHDEGQFQWVPLSEVREMVKRGAIDAAGTLVALLHVLAFGPME